MAEIHLANIPGFAQLDDELFQHDNPALGMLITRVSGNAAMGMVHLEMFDGMYVHGDVVPLPTSPIDGYVYERKELLYVWNDDISTSKDTGWIPSGSGALAICAWYVTQYGYDADGGGKVYSMENYRNGGSGGSKTPSNNGQIHVYTIAQRQLYNILPGTPSPTYSAISEANIATDKAFIDTSVAILLNENAKFACINQEVFYCGEYYHGQQVPLSKIVSRYDSYAFSYAETLFLGCFRWTTQGNLTSVVEPENVFGFQGPFSYSIDSSGNVTVHVWRNDVSDSGVATFASAFGRIGVFAFCKRSATPSSYSAVANHFAELPVSTFQSGGSLRASSVLQLKRNIDEALITPEFFGPTQYANGNTVPLPTSPIDGYAYSRSELTYMWVWADTMNQFDYGHRQPVFYGGITNTGVIGTSCWRLNSHYVHDADGQNRINVITVARRGKAASAAAGSSTASPPSDVTTSTTLPATDIDAYNISFDSGGGRLTPPGNNESLYKHLVGGNLTSVSLDTGLTQSYGGCRTAPAGAYAITIKKTHGGSTTTIGTINFTAGSTAATFTMSSAQTLVPGDVLEFVGAATADATIAGIYFTISGIRNQ